MANTFLCLPGGLINIPVKMYAATSSEGVKFNMFHVHDDGSASRINMPCVCAGCKEEVPRNQLVRGQERDGQAILVTDEELEELQLDAGKPFKVLRYCRPDEVDPLLYEAPYFLTPDIGDGRGRSANPQAAETYATFLAVLEETGLIGVVQYTMRQTTHLAMVSPRRRGDEAVLVLHNLAWPAELRAPEFAVLKRQIDINPRSLKLMTQIVEQEVEEFNAEEYVDVFAGRVKEFIDCKADGVPMTVREETEAAEEVGDLLAKLEATAAAQTQARAAHPAGKRRAAAKAPAKKAAPAKAPVRRKTA